MSQIVKVPASVLRAKAELVQKVDKRILDIVGDLEKTLISQTDPEGVGIAAPQIGVSLQIFFIRPLSPNKKPPTPTLFINPQIISLSKEIINPKSKGSMLEGCLSMPGYYGPVKRSKEVVVKYMTLGKENKFIEKTETFSDFPAQIIQHEYDHLVGNLFVDRILEQKGTVYKVDGDNWTKVDL
jgi:peptide deformylase